MGTHVASGSKIFVYPDGSSKQVDVDGSGVIIAKDGTRTDFTYGGDAAFEADRIASDKRPLDEAEENEAIPVSLLNDPLGSAGGYVNQVPGVGMATEYANKVPGVGMATSVAGKTKDRCCQLGKMIPGAKQAEEMAGKAKGMAGQVPGVGAVGDLTSGNVPGVGAVGDLAGKVPGAGQLKGIWQGSWCWSGRRSCWQGSRRWKAQRHGWPGSRCWRGRRSCWQGSRRWKAQRHRWQGSRCWTAQRHGWQGSRCWRGRRSY